MIVVRLCLCPAPVWRSESASTLHPRTRCRVCDGVPPARVPTRTTNGRT